MFDWITQWRDAKEAICRQIVRTDSDFKIVLKTKDEIYLLRRWLDHHLDIVGPGNVIVFDNGSSDPEIDRIYAEYKDRIVIAGFTSYPDDVHIQTKFPELYRALAESCRFFTFLDTDEYLVWMKDDGTYLKGSAVVEAVMTRQDVGVFPGVWLGNVPFFADRFYVSSGEGESDGDGEGGNDWGWGLKWGKPVIASRLGVEGNVHHNAYLDYGLYDQSCCTNIFILHIASFSREQRIASNMRKLKAIKFITEADTVESVLALDQSAIKHNLVGGYVSEIRELCDLEVPRVPPDSDLSDHTLRVNPDGTIEFFNEIQKAHLRNYVRNPREMMAKFLKPSES